MRCVKFERTIKPSPIFSPAKKSLSPPTSSSSTNLQAKRTASSPAKTLARPTQTQSQTLEETSTPRNKLISPISAASVELTIKAITRGQSAKSPATCSVKVETSMSSKAASKSEVKPGGRHPHPPNGNNKKLKHMCPFEGCLWRFATPYKLRRHIKSHTKETPYLCEECGRGFSVRYNLLMHIQTIHNQPQRYKCPIRGCKEAFHSQPRLNGHLRRVHKKDVKATERLSGRCDSRGNSTSSVDSVAEEELTVVRNTRQRRKWVCSECKKEFTSQAKLTLHSRTHTVDTPPKQDSEKSKDKVSKSSDTPKNFTCPHNNCGRVFLHQSHLKNHLKIHTKDHQFVCPVLDCNKQFGSEAEYNSHLNSHINYGYKCTHPSCELSFLSKKRLAFHTQVVHGNQGFHDGTQSSFLDGIQPHLGVNHQSSHLLSPLSCSSVFNYPQLPQDSPSQPIKSESSSYDFIKDIDLSDRSQKYFESVLSQNRNWSGEQIDRFLHSAVDLSEMEARLSSNGYESDSGYSTYDVSPIASHPPLTLPHPLQSLPRSHLQHSAGPMFNPACAYSPTNPVFPDGLHSATSSPCSTEVGFFSPPAELEPMAPTPNQTASFFPGELVPQGVQMYPPHSNGMFGATYLMEGPNPHVTMAGGYFNSRIPDILVHSAGHLESKGSSYVSCRRNSDSQVIIGESPAEVSRRQLVTQSLPNMGQLAHLIKSEFPSKESLPMCALSGQQLPKKEEGGRVYSCAVMEKQAQTSQPPLGNAASSQTPAASNGVPSTRATNMKATKKGKSTTTKTSQRRKNQWPRSMNQANMMAFRQHILNKLKKGQDTSTSESCGIKQEACSPKPIGESEFNMENSESEDYEVQVEVERNHSSASRSQSAPIEGSSPAQASLPSLHGSQSDSNLNKETIRASEGCEADTTHLTAIFSDDIFNSMNFNPDCLLSGADEEQMLKTLGFDESDEDVVTMLGTGTDSLTSTGSSTGDFMDLDCIQDLLNDTVASPLSLHMLPQPSLDTTIFGSAPSSPPNSSPVNHESPLSSYPSTTSQYTIPVESLVSMGDSNVSLSYSSSAYHMQPALYSACHDLGSCAPEIFDI